MRAVGKGCLSVLVIVFLVGVVGALGGSGKDKDTRQAVASPSPGPTPVMTLDELWTRSDWQGVISLLERENQAGKLDNDSREKLYAAYVNAGHQALKEGNTNAAKTRFSSALDVKPNGSEASEGAALAAKAPAASPQSVPTRSVPTSTPTSVRLRTGEEGRINDEVFAAVDDPSWDAMWKAINARDQMGMVELMARGKVFTMKTSTRVLVLENAFTSVKVRALDGSSVGKAGWIPYEYLSHLP